MLSVFVLLATSWLLGIAMGASHTLLWVLGPISAALLFWVFRQRSWPQLSAAILLLGLGFVYGDSQQGTPVPPCLLASSESLTIIERPYHAADFSRYIGETNSHCRVRLTAARFPVFAKGDVVQVTGGKIEYTDSLPPERAGFANYLRRQGIHAVWGYPALLRLSHNPLLSETAYERAHTQVTSLFPEPEASLIVALVLADTGTLSDELQTQFRATGVNHILSISGLHLSIIAGVLILLTSLLPLSLYARTAVIILLLYGYIAFIGQPIAAVRALVFWTVALLAVRLARLVSLPTMLICTLLLLITYRPLLLYDISFQLSCSAVAGIFLILFLTRDTLRTQNGTGRVLLSSIRVSLGATLATWPLVMYYFGTFSLVSLVANIIIVPLSTLLLLSSILALALNTVSGITGLFLAHLVHYEYVLMVSLNSFLSQVPAASFTNLSLPPWLVGTYYVGLLLVCLLWLRYQQRTWREVWE